MRKSLVAKEVAYFYERLNIEVSDRSSGGISYKVINNWFIISAALYKLNDFDFTGNSVQDIFDLGASFQSSAQSISILSSEYNGFLTKFNLVKAKCEAVIDSSKLEDDLQNIYVKLPTNLNDLTVLSSIIKELDLSFNKCPIFSDEIGQVTFKKVEEGSSWIVIAIGTVIIGSKVLDWIANFVKSCNEIRIQKRTIKNLDLDNILKKMGIDEKEQKKYKESYEEKENDEIKSICLEKFKQIGMENITITPEDESRIVHCMKTMINLLDEGIEIYPSVSSDESTKKLFPKQEEFKLLEESQKLLEEKNKAKN